MKYRPIKILHIGRSDGVGGCERNVLSLCRNAPPGFEPMAAWASHATSEGYLSAVRDLGLKAFCFKGRQSEVLRTVADQGIDAAILHRAGNRDRLWGSVLRGLAQGGVKAILECNVFGLPDLSSDDELIDLHLHKSMTSHLQFTYRAAAAGYKRISRHRVLFNATDVERFRHLASSEHERQRTRQSLGLSSNDFVMLRVGRPDIRKWSDFLLCALPIALQAIPNAKVVLMSAPRSRERWIRAQEWGHRCIFLPNTLDDARLVEIYGIADLLVHASRRGETYPNTILEAFSLKVPAVVNATPWRDNSQIEIVDHMVNGLVANTPTDYAQAIQYLAENREALVALGRNAAKTSERFEAKRVARQLHALVLQTMEGKHARVPGFDDVRTEQLDPSLDALATYGAEYARRLRNAWSAATPERGGSFVQRAAWLASDILDIFLSRFSSEAR